MGHLLAPVTSEEPTIVLALDRKRRCLVKMEMEELGMEPVTVLALTEELFQRRCAGDG